MINIARIFGVHVLVFASFLGCGIALAGQDHQPDASRYDSTWHSGEHSRVRLIRGGLTDQGQDLAGLVIEVDDGWHTYWRSPGSLGLPPTFNWQGSENVRGVTVQWPLPQHIQDGDYETYGYEDRLVLPLVVARENVDELAYLHLAIGYAVCETVCIPVLGFVSLNLPSREQASRVPEQHRWAIDDALSRVPTRDLEAAGLDVAPARLVRSEAAQRVLRLSIASDTRFEDPHIILEAPKGVRFGVPKLALDSTGRHLEALVPIFRDANAAAPIGPGIFLTIMGGRMAAETPLRVIISGDTDGVASPSSGEQ